jgi:DNA mismatch repair protein PMS2
MPTWLCNNGRIVIHCLQAYALVCTNVKFSFASVDGSRTSTILTTQGSAKLRDNFCTVFSAKQADMLADFNCNGSDWKVSGLFSKPVPNAGMASAERQFLFLNDRPIDFPKISRLCNEMYRRVSHSHPVFVLNIITPAHNVDVNLTPDKRTVLLHNESDIIAIMQATLKAMFEPTVQVFQVQTNTLDAFSTKISKSSSWSAAPASNIDTASEDVAPTSDASHAIAAEEEVIEVASSSPSDSALYVTNDQNVISSAGVCPQAVGHAAIDAHQSFRNDSAISVIADPERGAPSPSNPTKNSISMADGAGSNEALPPCDKFLASRRQGFTNDLVDSVDASEFNSASAISSQQQDLATQSSDNTQSQQQSCDATESFAHSRNSSTKAATSLFSNFARGASFPSQPVASHSSFSKSLSSLSTSTPSKVARKRDGSQSSDSESQESGANSSRPASHARAARASSLSCILKHNSDDSSSESSHGQAASRAASSKRAKRSDLREISDEIHSETHFESEPISEFLHPVQTTPGISLSIDWGKLMQQVSSGLGPLSSSGWKMWGASNSDPSAVSTSVNQCGNFQKSEIETHGLSHGTILTDRKIDKRDFTRMEVLGQFNKGFIIARLADDLYIIDQHASDEKCRFEMLQRNTFLRTQPLIAPLPLDLSPGDEDILEQRSAIFMKSGFNFRFDESDRPGRRARLTTVPFSNNVQLGPADVQEMLFLLKDNVDQHCRPSRITSMFASRACRSAVMIGDPLPLPRMRKVQI